MFSLVYLPAYEINLLTFKKSFAKEAFPNLWLFWIRFTGPTILMGAPHST